MDLGPLGDIELNTLNYGERGSRFVDSWTSYGVKGDRELPIRIERDTNASGKIDHTETFEIDSGEPVIARREEDKNGDGVIDVISIYENGKLVKREFTNPDMVDL